MQTRKRGRPPGLTYEYNRNIRLKVADLEDIEALASAWRCSQAETIRRAIRETARRERRGTLPAG